MGDNLVKKKWGNGALRKLLTSNYSHGLEMFTNPVREYGVVYDIQQDIVVKGKKVRAVYGQTLRMEPLWRILLNSKTGLTWGFAGDYFMLGNLLAFYQIHKTKLRMQDIEGEELDKVMTWFLNYLYGWNKDRGIEIHVIESKGSTWQQELIRRAKQYFDIDVYSEEGAYFSPFFYLTDIFPGNEVGRRSILHSKAKRAFHTSVGYVVEAMKLEDALVTKRLVEEYNSVVMQDQPTNLLQNKYARKQAGITFLTKHRVGSFYKEAMGLNDEQRLRLRISHIIAQYSPRSTKQLSEYLGESLYVTNKLLDTLGDDVKQRLLNGWLIEIGRQAQSKEDFVIKSELSRYTISRRAGKNQELSQVWKSLD